MSISMIDASIVDMVRLGAEFVKGRVVRVTGPSVKLSGIDSTLSGLDSTETPGPRAGPGRHEHVKEVHMDTNYTTKSQEAISGAMQAAAAAGNPQIEPAHLLVELLAQPDGVAAGLLAVALAAVTVLL